MVAMSKWMAWTMGLALVGTTGCMTYRISKDLRQQARTTEKAGFAAIALDPAAFQGQVVIWGGHVIKTENDTNGTSIYVLQSPLNTWERPRSSVYSRGRFIARSSGFLDPEVHKPGTLVTIAGELTGTETHSVDNRPYAYPVVSIKELSMWKPAPEVYWVAPPYYYYGPGWPWYGPYWYWPNYDSYYYFPPGPERGYRYRAEPPRSRSHGR